MKANDAITGGIFLAVAILAFLYAGTFTPLPGVKYGPDLFPRLVSVLMGLGGVILIVGALRPAGRQPLLSIAQWARTPRSYLIIVAVLGSIVFYILLSDRLGFLLTAFIMLSALLIATRGISRTVSSLVISASVVVVLYLIFARLLRVPLPVGVIESLVS